MMKLQGFKIKKISLVETKIAAVTKNKKKTITAWYNWLAVCMEHKWDLGTENHQNKKNVAEIDHTCSIRVTLQNCQNKKKT